MDHLKEGIGLRGYGQKDPLVEYKKESYVLFQDMMDRIEDETIRWLFFMHRSDEGGTTVIGDIPQNVPYPEVWADEPEEEEEGEPVGVGAQNPGPGIAAAPQISDAQRQAAQNSVADLTRTIQRKKEKELAAMQLGGDGSSTAKQPVIAKKTVGRNDPCPCGSGKKYKKCCGQ